LQVQTTPNSQEKSDKKEEIINAAIDYIAINVVNFAVVEECDFNLKRSRFIKLVR